MTDFPGCDTANPEKERVLSEQTLTIDRLGRRGEGLADAGGRRVAVPFTLPGETVEIAFEDESAALRKVLRPSPDRVEPFCAHFGECGGCQLQHLAPAAYGGFKRGLVEAGLAGAGLTAPVDEMVAAHGAGRRRATLHTRRHGAGYTRWHSHDVLAIEACPILVPALADAPRIAASLFEATGECDVGFTASLTGLDVAVRGARRARREQLATIARRLDFARLTLDRELVFKARTPIVRMGRAEVELPAGAFLQATEAAEEALSELVLAALSGRRRVADLFSGLGPFALRLAERARVLALDSDAAAIAALDRAARTTPRLKPLEARRRDLFLEPLSRFELEGFDAALFDPPRAGARDQARELARSGLKTVVAVSCDPRSFARDAAILTAGGFGLERVTPVDQFAWSAHVELVAVFMR